MRRCTRTASGIFVVVLLLGALTALTGRAIAATGSWSARLADLPGAAALGDDGAGVTVAVLDTWIDAAHPDFGGRVLPGVTCTQGSCRPGADRPDGCDPHGTHVAGIVASRTYGVAPRAHILPIRVLTSRSGSCAADARDVAMGIQYAIDHSVKIINVSLGSTFPLDDPDGVLPAAVTRARQAGDLVVVAAGNGQATAADTYGTDALTVAALGPTGAIASYSQHGEGVDLAAPGGDAAGSTCDPAFCIVSTWADGGYASDAGTSMAAPFVSGTAALLLAANPRQPMAAIRSRILRTAVPLSGAGAGRLDVLAAVRSEATTTPPPAAPSPAAGAGAITGSSAVRTAPPSTATREADRQQHASNSRPLELLGILLVSGVGLAVAMTAARRHNERGSAKGAFYSR